MEPSLTLTTLLPVLRSIATLSQDPDASTVTITIDRSRFGGNRVSTESMSSLFRSLGMEILNQTEDRIVTRLPVKTTFQSFVEDRLNLLTTLYQPRPLTSDEIEDLLASIPRVLSPIEEVSERARDEIIRRIRDQLSEIVITPLGIPDLRDALVVRFERARVEPGETVGLTVAEALSALTQAALNAFHQSGSKSNISAGIEMLQDLLAARVERKAEQCNIHFWDKNLTFEQVFSKRSDLVQITVGNLILDYAVTSPHEIEPYWWITLYPQLTGRQLPTAASVLRLNINKTKMLAHEITVDEISQAIETFNAPSIVTVVGGPIDSGIILIYPDEELIREPLQKKNIPIADNIAETFLTEILLPTLQGILIKGISGIRGISPVSTTTWGVVERETKAIDDDIIKTLDDPEDRRRASRSWILQLSSFIMGREGIIVDKLVILLTTLQFEVVEIQEEYVTIIAPNDQSPTEYVNQRVTLADATIEQRRKERLTAQRARRKARQNGQEGPQIPVDISDDQNEISRAGRYVYATTTGSNLTALFARHDVDTRRTTCNNPHTTLHLLGVEAARNLAISEFIYILETSGLELDPRHIILLADFMTNRGILLPISFWGMVRSKQGPLTVASFGKAVSVFRTAAAFGDSERIRTTASGMYVGQRGQFGSGMVDLRIDEDKIRAFEEETARLQEEGRAYLEVQDVETAIDQLDMITFGSEPEIEQADPLAELASLNVPVPETRIGNGTISRPIEVVRPVPIISTLVQQVTDGIEVAQTQPAMEVRQVLPRRSTGPKPNTIRLPITRRRLDQQPPQEIPKAHI